MLDFLAGAGDAVLWSICRWFRRLLGWETEREREEWEAKDTNPYVPPQYVTSPRSEPEREATRRRMRERVAARRARDAARRPR